MDRRRLDGRLRHLCRRDAGGPYSPCSWFGSNMSISSSSPASLHVRAVVAQSLLRSEGIETLMPEFNVLMADYDPSMMEHGWRLLAREISPTKRAVSCAMRNWNCAHSPSVLGTPTMWKPASTWITSPVVGGRPRSEQPQRTTGDAFHAGVFLHHRPFAAGADEAASALDAGDGECAHGQR